MTSLLYVRTKGIDTLERLYSPFILARTAKGMRRRLSSGNSMLLRSDEPDETMWF